MVSSPDGYNAAAASRVMLIDFLPKLKELN
jgi:hypothetical protein